MLSVSWATEGLASSHPASARTPMAPLSGTHVRTQARAASVAVAVAREERVARLGARQRARVVKWVKAGRNANGARRLVMPRSSMSPAGWVVVELLQYGLMTKVRPCNSVSLQSSFDLQAPCSVCSRCGQVCKFWNLVLLTCFVWVLALMILSSSCKKVSVDKSSGIAGWGSTVLSTSVCVCVGVGVRARACKLVGACACICIHI